MASVSTYLSFSRQTEEAFEFYRSVFGGEFGGDGISRMGDMPPSEGAPALSPADEQLVMHVELSILGGHLLMGNDAPESMGFHVNMGNNYYICLNTDSRAETDRLFAQLSEGGAIEMELQDTFWGAYYGICSDKFGVRWMLNFGSEGN